MAGAPDDNISHLQVARNQRPRPHHHPDEGRGGVWAYELQSRPMETEPGMPETETHGERGREGRGWIQ